MQQWWKTGTIYQIYPKSFYDSNQDGIGDLNGIKEKLPYLQSLGIDCIWICPVYKSPMVDNGYDVSDYYQIHPQFGTMEDMDALLASAQEHNIKIMMDLVFNHVSDQHPWFQEAKKSKQNTYREYFIWRDEPNELKSNFGGSAWEYDEKTKQYYLHFYSSKQPDLNWENKQMRQELYDIIDFWIDKGVKGFRFDVIDLIGKVPDKMIKENGPKLHDYLYEMVHQSKIIDHNIVTVGETWGANADIAKLYSEQSREEFSMVFEFEKIQVDKTPGLSRWDYTAPRFKELKTILTRWQYGLQKQGWNSLFWNNHDLPRVVSRFGNDKEYREVSSKMLATILYGMRGTPYVYQGEELGMTNTYYKTIEDYQDLETQNMYVERLKAFSKEETFQAIQKKARDNARSPMQWNNSAYAGFSLVAPWQKVNENYLQINVENQLRDENSILNHYKNLIGLRKKHAIFVDGEFHEIKTADNVYMYTRELNDSTLLVVGNFSKYCEPIKLPFDYNQETCTILSKNYEKIQLTQLRPYESYMILFQEGGQS